MDGERDVPLLTPIPPLPVIVRRSSDAVAIDDPEIAEALRIIESRFAEDLSVEDLARQLTISRRALERRFREQLGRTLYDEITRARITHAKQLLSNTEIPISAVARQCGFSGTASLGRAFARSEGLGPGAYRRQARAR
jgi:LacI family transcriptional regulator